MLHQLTDLGCVFTYTQVPNGDSLLRLKLLTWHRHVISVLVFIIFIIVHLLHHHHQHHTYTVITAQTAFSAKSKEINLVYRKLKLAYDEH